MKAWKARLVELVCGPAKYYPVVELAVAGKSLAVVFFEPTRFRWTAELKILRYAYCHREGRVDYRIVDADRADYLRVSYAEWLLRQQTDGVPA